MPKTQINLEGWQDYRGNAAGSLLYVETSHQSEMPVRDQLNENGKGFLYEPNYETSTYGLMSCYNVKAINAILKAKSRYILFGTRYEGLSDSELRNKYLIMGYMRIDKIKDVRTRHIQRYMANPELQEPECMQMEHNWAVYGPMRFVSMNDAFVVTDEVYEHIVYEPLRHTYMASLPGMAGRTLSCSSLSKTYSITGWRLGYVIASAPVVERVRKVHDFLTVGAAAPLQEAAVAGLRMDDSYYAGLLALYARKRKIMLDGLRSLGIPHTEPQGAYYVMLDISGFGWDDDVLFCEKLAERVGVGAVPGSSFFHEPENRFIRLHFAKKDETLFEALDRLSSMRARMVRP